MKIRAGWGAVAALGLLAAAGLSYRAQAQVGFFSPHPAVDSQGLWTIHPGGVQLLGVPQQQASWGEVITATPRWLVVQNQAGQQFPIAADRIRQFLVRWPSSADQLTPNSAVEVTGPDAGMNTIIADHIDHYEADAQNLVSPTVQTIFGNNRTFSPFDLAQQNSFQAVYWLTSEEYSMPNRMHIVGNPVSNNPVQLAGFANSVYTVRPSGNGMTVTQITLGTVSYAKRGDLVYLTPENVTARSLDVSQLVLYKKIPLRQFQP